MHTLTYELTQLAGRFREGSYASQANRHAMLKQFAEQLYAAGYKKMHADELKGRHLSALLERWRADGVSSRTLANRLACLRWWSHHVGNSGLMKPTNAAYGVAPRQSVPRVSKARDLPEQKLASVRNAHVRMSLELQRAFGMRREEAIKCQPHLMDKGDHILLKASWCKGGHSREVPIITLSQREILDKAKAFVQTKGASLIPAHKSYAQQVKSYEHATRMAGLDHLHGLRHAYAMRRYEELAGFPCPLAEGPHAQDLTPAQRETDYEARLILSEELGHHREQITASYIGR